MKEIERKWVLPYPAFTYPHTLLALIIRDLSRVTEIEQGYVMLRPIIVRVWEKDRQRGTSFELTIKTRHPGLRWLEITIPIWERLYEFLLERSHERVVRKTRMELPYMKHILELDYFRGDLDGNALLGCKFPSEEEAERFVLPAWIPGKPVEVTDDDRYRNDNLATDGWPSQAPQSA